MAWGATSGQLTGATMKAPLLLDKFSSVAVDPDSSAPELFSISKVNGRVTAGSPIITAPKSRLAGLAVIVSAAGSGGSSGSSASTPALRVIGNERIGDD